MDRRRRRPATCRASATTSRRRRCRARCRSGQNSPQRAAYGLYAEQLSGSPFTAPRGANERSWLYRIRPSVKHTPQFKKTALPFWKTAPCLGEHDRPIGQLRWGPVPIPKEKLDFLTGMRTMTTAGDVNTQAGMAAHVYLVTHRWTTSTSTMPTASC